MKALFLSLLLTTSCCLGIRYEPTWESIDSRPLPQWYDDSKLGIFIHWGVYSVPGFSNEWFWEYWQGAKKRKHTDAVNKFMKDNYRPDWTYADFATQFRAEFYDPNHWADVLKQSGAQYVVLTTKHHDGFCLWPTNHSFNWNSMDVGPKRDLVGELARAIRSRTDIHFGIHHSMYEWFNPLYLRDKANNRTTRDFVNNKALPALYELVNSYEPDLIWSAGAHGSSKYWNSTGFLAWLYNDSPVKDKVVVNDRWGTGARCQHGGFYACFDRYDPEAVRLIDHKWENCITIDTKSWGYRRTSNLDEYLTIEDILQKLIFTVSFGGNLLLNIGPTADGRITPIFEERLRQLGSWMKVNGEAIYKTKPWQRAQEDNVTSLVWYTSSKNNSDEADNSVYAITLQWPNKDRLKLGAVKPTVNTTVYLLGYDEPLRWKNNKFGGITVILPILNTAKMPCQWAWSFKFNNIEY